MAPAEARRPFPTSGTLASPAAAGGRRIEAKQSLNFTAWEVRLADQSSAAFGTGRRSLKTLHSTLRTTLVLQLKASYLKVNGEGQTLR